MTLVGEGRNDIHTHFLPDGYRAALRRHGLDTIAVDRDGGNTVATACGCP
jgi:hypothetical protein